MFFKQLRSKKIDIICLQETHILASEIETWERQWGGKVYAQPGTERSKGEVILIAKHFQGKTDLIISQERLIMISVESDGYVFNIANVYAPNITNDKILYFKRVQDKLEEYVGENLVLVGDFNCVVNNTYDIISGRPHKKVEVDHFNDFIQRLCIVDVWRSLHSNEKDFTWNRFNPFIARRLDYCLLSTDMLSSVVTCEHSVIPNTDHKVVVLELNNTNFVRGPGYWRFNNSFLKDKTFVQSMNELLEESVSNNENEGEGFKWEMTKIKIRNFCTEFGKRRSCKLRNDRIVFEKRIKDIEKQLINEVENKTLQQQLLEAKQKYEIIELDKGKGAQIRSRMRWIEDGERNTKFFCNLERSRKRKNIMTKLRNDSGDLIVNQNEIMKEQVKFYQKLYNQELNENAGEAKQEFLEGLEMPKLSEQEAQECEGQVTEDEATGALKDMSNGSAPGSDGLTVEFYKFFWSKIKHCVVNGYNESFTSGLLSYTQNQGVITLIHKGNDLDRELLTNWRPITLTNIDYKILAKVLAKRLGGVIDKLVAHDQVGYIRGRNIATVLRTIDDVINYLNKTGKVGYILALDFSKAFDSISKTYLNQVFKMFGFGQDFQRWVSIIISNSVSCINYGGWLSGFFSINSGIKQGCPFSPLAFILAVEVLAVKMRNSQVEGIELPSWQAVSKRSIKIKQMADDTTLFLRNKKDIESAVHVIKLFSKFSGLILNERKTKLLGIGKQGDEETLPFENVDKVKILGIVFSNKVMAQKVEENWKDRIKTLQLRIGQWSKRDLSIQGKVVVIKTFLVSPLLYVMQSIGMPSIVLNQINRLLYKFLWQRKHSNKRAFEKVKRKVMEADYKDGGVKMVNVHEIQKCFYLQWMGKLHEVEQNWVDIPLWHLKRFAGDSVFKANCNRNDLTNQDIINNEFWKEAYMTFLDNKTPQKRENVTRYNVLQQCLFNNTFVRYKEKTLNFVNWSKAGFSSLGDIVKLAENCFYSEIEMQGKIVQNKAVTWFEYKAVLSAIPKQWKEWISAGVAENSNNNTNLDILEFNKKIKYIKVYLKAKNKDYQTRPNAVLYWQRTINFDLTSKHWMLPKETSNETRLRELQWKVLHNLYPTNILLNKMGKTDSCNCSYCDNTIDYIEHFFYECPKVRAFWRYVEQKLVNSLNISIKLSVKVVLFGLIANEYTSVELKQINHMILIGKMCISKVKKTRSPMPLDVVFEQDVKIREPFSK
jgi:exonuclease III